MFESKGIKFLLNKEILNINGNKNKRAESVSIKEKDKLEDIPAEIVVIGKGAVPNSEVVVGEVTTSANSIKCDVFCATSHPDVYSAGDVCSYPSMYNSERLNVQLYANAIQQGTIAALNMLDKKVMYDYVPRFSTKLFDVKLEMVGQTSSFDDVFITGDINKLKFEAYYLRKNEIVGFACSNSPASANIMYESFRHKITPVGNAIKNGKVNLESLKFLLDKTKIKCARVESLGDAPNKI